MSDPLRIDSWNSEGIRFSRRLTDAQLSQLSQEAAYLFPDGWLARVDAAGPRSKADRYQACRSELEYELVMRIEAGDAAAAYEAIERTIIARLVLMGAIPPV